MNLEHAVAAKLAKLSPYPLHLEWHENRSSYLSFRKIRGSIHLRLHRLFKEAPSPVLEALIAYAIKRDRRAGAIVRQMAHLYFSKEKMEPDALLTKGKVFDLHPIRDKIKAKYFKNLEVAIGWSAHARARGFRCITFGSYDRCRNQVRINPLLDDVEVPLYFLEFIVYHEMLHAICLSEIGPNGKIHSHTREFRALERKFSEFQAAKEWEKKSLAFFKKKQRP